MASAASFKDQGNEEFKKENFLKAAALYTQAIKADPENAVLYSNRSAALLKLNKVTKALEDAETAIRLKPEWEKGYFRKAAALEVADKLQEALEVYQLAAKRAEAESGGPSKELANKIRTLSKLHKIKVSHKEDTLVEALLAAVGAAGITGGDLAALNEFAKDMAGHAEGNVREQGHDFPPSVHFLPGSGSASHEEKERHVMANLAFTAPEVYAEFVTGMRATAERLAAAAVLAVIPKAAVAYPQTWSRKGWPASCGGPRQHGLFVQLDVRTGAGGCSRHAWFLPIASEGKGDAKALGKPTAVSAEDFGPLPPLIK
ncbi:hypothetical protein HYH02_000373 [Chlamydomonas schloesseri]|uniref:Uncharacterized protein n=1 Tax=Chlamydomonas schloesseri TaxID=2026947 RepID=A0A835WVP9_9CHLO|nr:hypothetical protein HYH02_000373 [Chlamydomonas schloesseri]|eukprot:KAG2454526.1 hypothetical protein HYH02_000373 [Chlamydomonas schloesseri]